MTTKDGYATLCLGTMQGLGFALVSQQWLSPTGARWVQFGLATILCVLTIWLTLTRKPKEKLV